MKIAPIIDAIDNLDQDLFRYRLIHTGQHYDMAMSEAFFDQLKIPKPDVNLGVGSGSQAEQTSAIMVAYEDLLKTTLPDLCLVVGDVNSTLACSIVAKKMSVKVAHVEAGLRSLDWSMPEEINRVVTDSISDIFFTTGEIATSNLKNENVGSEQVHFVGNVMIDTLLKHIDSLKPPSFWETYGLSKGNYFVLTLHRPHNVDDREKLLEYLNAISESVRSKKIVFPAHPRTKKLLSELESVPSNICIADPQPYLEFNYLVKNSFAVLTDSGGVTEEATILDVPCFTLRNNTERPETVSYGTNTLIGTDPQTVGPALNNLFEKGAKKGVSPPKWDGQSGKRIVKILSDYFDS